MEPVNLDNTKQLERIAAAVERIAEAEARGAELGAEIVQRTGTEPAGVPILLIVEVLIALIKILWKNLPLDARGFDQLGAILRKLEPYQPDLPVGKEVE